MRLAVAAGTADFLIVGFDRIGDIGMDDETDLAAIDTHSEGIRGHDHALGRSHEPSWTALRSGSAKTRVVRRRFNSGAAEAVMNLIDIFSCSGVYDSERRPAGQFDNGANFFGVGRDLSDFKIQDWAGRIRSLPGRALDTELRDDVTPHRRRCRAVSARTGGDFEFGLPDVDADNRAGNRVPIAIRSGLRPRRKD